MSPDPVLGTSDRPPSSEELLGALPLTSEVELVDGVITYQLSAPGLRVLLAPLVRRRARAIEHALLAGQALPTRPPWWAPPAPMGADAVQAVVAAALFAMLIGYGGALLTQTNAYAADLFDVTDHDLGIGLAFARLGVLVAVFCGARIDRIGRRRFVIFAVVLHAATTVLAGLAPTFPLYIAAHTITGGLDTAAGIALAVLVAESVEPGNRAFAVSLAGVVGGFGIFLASLTLPIAASGRTGFALVHLVQLVALPIAWAVRNFLRESPRFTRDVEAIPRWRQLLAGVHARRLALAGGALFLGLCFLGPATELTNRYLDKQRDLSPGQIVLFLLLSSLPFLPMTVVGARLADVRGRRPVAVVAVIGAAACYGALYLTDTPWLWALGPLGTVFAAPAYAAVSVYGTELFPTPLRATAAAAINAMGVAGSALGLLIAAWLAGRGVATGTAIAALAPSALLAALLVAARFPETAGRTLESTSSGI